MLCHRLSSVSEVNSRLSSRIEHLHFLWPPVLDHRGHLKIILIINDYAWRHAYSTLKGSLECHVLSSQVLSNNVLLTSPASFQDGKGYLKNIWTEKDIWKISGRKRIFEGILKWAWSVHANPWQCRFNVVFLIRRALFQQHSWGLHVACMSDTNIRGIASTLVRKYSLRVRRSDGNPVFSSGADEVITRASKSHARGRGG